MQQIFCTEVSPEEYQRLARDFPFPVVSSCPSCHTRVPLQKHGFYRRTVDTGNWNGRIYIRRYRCKRCGKTVSLLPSFCLPYFQYTVELIYMALEHIFSLGHSLRACLVFLKACCHQLSWGPSYLQFYARRFLSNLPRIYLVLRMLLPDVSWSHEADKRKGAKEVLRLMAAGFPRIQTFSTRFYHQCGHSFMAPS